MVAIVWRHNWFFKLVSSPTVSVTELGGIPLTAAIKLARVVDKARSIYTKSAMVVDCRSAVSEKRGETCSHIN